MATPELSKIEYAAIHIASGVHGTVAPDQLAVTSVEIAAAVLLECDHYESAHEAAMDHAKKADKPAEPTAAEVEKAAKRIEAAGKLNAAFNATDAAIKAAADQKAKELADAKAEAAAAEKAAKSEEHHAKATHAKSHSHA